MTLFGRRQGRLRRSFEDLRRLNVFFYFTFIYDWIQQACIWIRQTSAQGPIGDVPQPEDEFHGELIDHAMAGVPTRVESLTWDAFRVTALEGCSGAAAAAQLEMNWPPTFSRDRAEQGRKGVHR
jgi:hypothetical protein